MSKLTAISVQRAKAPRSLRDGALANTGHAGNPALPRAAKTSAHREIYGTDANQVLGLLAMAGGPTRVRGSFFCPRRYPPKAQSNLTEVRVHLAPMRGILAPICGD